MDIFLQTLINGLTLGSIYGLIAIGYTMVFGIIGMVNFAHGDLFMLSAFVALILFLIITQLLGVGSVALAFLLVLVGAMLITSLWNWAIERVAYRPLRGSFRLAPLISAIGMSIFLSNMVQVVQGPRNKTIPPMFDQLIQLTPGGAFDVTISYKQILIMVSTVVLLSAFWYLVQKTSLGRAQTRLRTGPAHGGAARHRRRPHDLADLRDRRGARGRRRRALPELLRRRRLFGRVRAGREGLHGGGAGRASDRCRAPCSGGC